MPVLSRLMTLAMLTVFCLDAHWARAQNTLPAAQESPTIRIGAGDLIDILVYDNPDLGGKYRVDEKGNVVLPLAGPIHIAGSTIDEAETIIEKRYIQARILVTPQVTLFIEEYVEQKVVVSGEVKSPGLYPEYTTRSINDILTQAGGVTTLASSKVIVIRKGDPDHKITVAYNPETLSPIVGDVQISPGDTVVVPRAGVVYVIGGAQKPGAYVLEGRDTLSLQKLMALAGGGVFAARMDKSLLIRETPDGTKIEAQVALQQILKGKRQDILMHDGDVLFIPTTGLKTFGQQVTSTLIGTGVGTAIYRVAY